MNLEKFNRDPYLYTRYMAAHAIVFFLIDILLVVFPSPLVNMPLPPISWPFWIILSVLVGIESAVFIHNASHGTFKPQALGFIVGEICGLHQLYGFLGWKIPHMIHHRFTDDPEKDPHAPRKETFLQYFFRMRGQIRKRIYEYFFEQFGDTPKTRRNVKIQKTIRIFVVTLHLGFWFFLLGPKLLFLFYIPSYMTTAFFFGHLNYCTHSFKREGDIEILNLNEGILYRFLNWLTFGTYFHKNHHERADLFNPATLTKKAA